MTNVFEARLSRAGEAAAEAGLTGLLVTPGADLRYFAGYAPPPLERLTMLIVAPRRDPVMLVPELERAAAEASKGGTAVEIQTWSDGDDPYGIAAKLLDRAGRYAICDSAWASHLLGLQGVLPEVRFVASGRALPLLRAIKDETELTALADAARAADRSFEAILSSSFEGRREADIGRQLADLLRRNGHDTVDFTIVGSGPTGASPRHEVS